MPAARVAELARRGGLKPPRPARAVWVRIPPRARTSRPPLRPRRHFGSAALTLAVEEGGDGSIDSFGDALWWAITTVTTVGYGDTFPVTPAGRCIAWFLMITGIALFGVITANVAAFFMELAKRRRPIR